MEQPDIQEWQIIDLSQLLAAFKLTHQERVTLNRIRTGNMGI